MGTLTRLLFGRSLKDALNKTRTVRVHGVKFTIKKIDPVAHLTGSKVMLQHYDEYKGKREAAKQMHSDADLMKATREHYKDVFLTCVQWPKLCRKPEDATQDVIPVDHLLTEWSLAVELYMSIIEFTYGKKKIQRFSTSLARSS